MFHELEYKYKADGIGLKEFKTLIESLSPERKMDVSSWDTYYTKGESAFMRFRDSKNSPELTIKEKTTNGNNWVRIEVDLPLDIKRVNKPTVDKFSQLLGYKENFSIYKSCFIYWLPQVNYVYYIVYDDNLREKARFIEVEINKDAPGVTEDTLDDAAKVLLSLDLTPQNRLKKSLFEMFRKA